KDASVSADHKAKTYGEDNPALTATVTGTVTGGDAVAYTLATTAVKLSGVGDYPITVTVGSNPNYDVTKTDDTLSVGAKTLTATITGTQTYGSTPDHDAAFSGFVGGQDDSIVTGTLGCTTTGLTSLSGVGQYDITSCSGLDAANYDVHYDLAK